MSKNKEIYGTITTYNDSNSRIVLKADSIVDSVVDKFIDRSRVGKAKYGVTLDREDWSLDQWLVLWDYQNRRKIFFKMERRQRCLQS